MEYGITAALAGMTHVAKHGHEWLYNFYQVHRDSVNDKGGPFAFVVPTNQRDPYGAYEMLDMLKFGEVEIHRATASFTADGASYPAGSYVVKTAQPYGGFAKTMLSRQDTRICGSFPVGRPSRPTTSPGTRCGC